jgi:hypothetical protein
VPWGLGPADGRYLLRAPGDPPDAAPQHVMVLATLGAVERRRVGRRKRKANPQVEPELPQVATGRATVIDAGQPLTSGGEAGSWLRGAGEDYLAGDMAVLNRAMHSHRLATADPYAGPIGRDQLLVARIGYGLGEEVADGLWTEARELILAKGWQRRSKVLQPQARLAALLGGHDRGLACEELALRARLDVDAERWREAALQVMVALDAAIAELAVDPAADALGERLQELRDQRDPIAHAAQAALQGPLSAEQQEAVSYVVGRIEAALRARAVARPSPGAR